MDFLAHSHPVLAVPCPSCNKPAGAWCIRPSGHRAMMMLHAERKRAADGAWERYGVPLIIRNADGSFSYTTEGGQT